MRYSGRKYPTTIVKSVLQYSPLHSDLPALKWGRDHEEMARSKYAMIMSETHQNFQTKICGLVINPKWPYLAASPDGMCSCDCCGSRLLEIKCPYKHRNAAIHQAVLSRDFYLKAAGNGKVGLSTKHNYYSQVQAQLLVTEEMCCDFVCWTEKDIFMESIMVDPNFKNHIPKLKNFFCTYILPELLTHSFKDGRLPLASEEYITPVKNGDEVVEASEEDIAPVKNGDEVVEEERAEKYCVCGEDKPGTWMIGCDNPECPVEWYHYSCVGIKRKPKGDWYCKKCKI